MLKTRIRYNVCVRNSHEIASEGRGVERSANARGEMDEVGREDGGGVDEVGMAKGSVRWRRHRGRVNSAVNGRRDVRRTHE
jgi:hypothetical protein